MEDSRRCEQCGKVFEPRREHSRFCSSLCRVTWNRENAGSQLTSDTPLNWSVAGVDNKLAHPMGLPLLKATDEIAVATHRGKNILARPAGCTISGRIHAQGRQPPARRP